MKALSSSVHKSAMECPGGQRIPSSLWFFSLETHALGACQFQKRRPRYHVHAMALDVVERLLRWRNCLELVFLTHFTFIYLPNIPYRTWIILNLIAHASLHSLVYIDSTNADSRFVVATHPANRMYSQTATHSWAKFPWLCTGARSAGYLCHTTYDAG
jgi:hypothetical protein